MSYLYLLIGLVCLGLLGVLHKAADHRRCRPEAINLFLFAWAAVIVGGAAAWKLGPLRAALTPLPAVAVAAACGTCATLAILFFQRGIRHGKISTSWLIINLSTVVPTLLSIFIYREQIGTRRLASLLLALAALLMLWLERRREEASQNSRTVPSKAGRT